MGRIIKQASHFVRLTSAAAAPSPSTNKVEGTPAPDVLEAARQEAERIKSRAALEGRERGLQAVTELLVRARQEAARLRSESEKDLKVLAVRIAEKILGQELTQKPDAVLAVVRQVLTHAAEAQQLTIRVSPEDLALVERGKPKLLERTRGVVHFRADENVARGGCIVDSELGVIDARLSTQIEAIERALRGEKE